MNHNRIDKLIEEANALRKVEQLNDPTFAPWMERAEQSFDQAVERLRALHEESGWDDETVEQLEAILINHWQWTLAWLELCRKPEPRAKIRWCAIFPDWLALVPAELHLATLQELRKERPKDTCNWLDDWLRFLSWGYLKLPEGLTMESMGVVIRTVIENSGDLDRSTFYCKNCAMLYPMRKREFSGILPSCPNCGNVGHAYVHFFG